MKYYFETVDDVLNSGYDVVKLREFEELREHFNDVDSDNALLFDVHDPGMDRFIYDDLKSWSEYIDITQIERNNVVQEWFCIRDRGIGNVPPWTYHVYMLEPVLDELDMTDIGFDILM